MRKNFGREIALLSLPVLLFGGAALWNSKLKGHFKIKSWSGFGAPRGLFEGKPRLEITDWHKEIPTTLDFARGISSRWTVTTWGGGVCPADGKPPRYGGMEYPKNLIFKWKRAGKWHWTTFKYEESELDVLNFGTRRKPTSNEVRLGLPLDLVPKDAEEVRLQGHMDGWMMCRSGSISFPSAPIDLVVKAPREAWPQFNGTREAKLKLQSTTQSILTPNPARRGAVPLWEVESTFSYFGSSSSGSAKKARSWVVDRFGNQMVSILSDDWYDVMNGMTKAVWRFDKSKLNPKNGPFTLKSWVYVDENEWPLQVSIPLKLPKSPKAIR